MTRSAVDERDRHRTNGAGRSVRRAEPVSRARDGVLLTGATGFLGMELLARYLERTERRVYALVRGADDREVALRMESTLRSLFGARHGYLERVVPVRGDITRPHLGLVIDRDRLA